MVLSASAPTLLREWELLQSDVIPPLLQDSIEPPTAWSIGSIDDAVALAVAFQHAQRSDACDLLDVYASDQSPWARETGFGLADLRSVPSAKHSACLVRHDRRWVADESLAEHVYLSDPSDPVDLVTLRATEDDSHDRLANAVEQLRPGGRLLLISKQRDYEDSIPGLKAVGANGTGRVYRKCSSSKPSRGRSATQMQDHGAARDSGPQEGPG